MHLSKYYFPYHCTIRFFIVSSVSFNVKRFFTSKTNLFFEQHIFYDIQLRQLRSTSMNNCAHCKKEIILPACQVENMIVIELSLTTTCSIVMHIWIWTEPELLNGLHQANVLEISDCHNKNHQQFKYGKKKVIILNFMHQRNSL